MIFHTCANLFPPRPDTYMIYIYIYIYDIYDIYMIYIYIYIYIYRFEFKFESSHLYHCCCHCSQVLSKRFWFEDWVFVTGTSDWGSKELLGTSSCRMQGRCLSRLWLFYHLTGLKWPILVAINYPGLLF